MGTRSEAYMKSEKQHGATTAGPLSYNCSSKPANDSLGARQLKAKAVVHHHSHCQVPGPASKRSLLVEDHLSMFGAGTVVSCSAAAVNHHRHSVGC